MLPFDTMGAWPSRAGAGALSAVIGFSGVSGCTAATPADWWDDGSGGSKPVALLANLRAEGLNCAAERIAAMSCQFVDDGVMVHVKREPSGGDPYLMSVFFGGLAPAQGTTPASGEVRISGACFIGVSSARAPDPCELELQGIERGEPGETLIGSGGAPGLQTVELGSRVRIRVSCPDGLNYPGTDDVNAYYIPIVPSEFALEAQDCVVVDDGVLPEGQP